MTKLHAGKGNRAAAATAATGVAAADHSNSYMSPSQATQKLIINISDRNPHGSWMIPGPGF